MSPLAITEVPAALGAADHADADGRTGARRWRRWWPVGLVALALVAFVVISLWPRAQNSADLLAPSNPKGPGAAALAEVLRQNGVPVTDVRNLADAKAALGANPGARLVLFENRVSLDERQLAELAAASESAVLIAPSAATLEAFTPAVRLAGVAAIGSAEADGGSVALGAVPANCADPDAVAAESVTRGSRALGVAPSVYRSEDGPVCFRDTEDAGGLFVRDTVRGIDVLGSARVWTNDQIDQDGNAALALRVLSGGEGVVWYLPGEEDLATQASAPLKSPLSYLPTAYNFVIGWLLVCALFLVLWRARRVGPLVLEPLPVTVPAAETAMGRARLYENARARAHAAQNLRSAAMVRISKKLGVGRGADARHVRDELVARLPGREQLIRDVMDADLPQTDRQLAAFAHNVRELEGAVEEL